MFQTFFGFEHSFVGVKYVKCGPAFKFMLTVDVELRSGASIDE